MQGRKPIRHAGHEVLAVALGSTRTHTHLRRRLAIILGATAAFAVLCTVVVYLAEHGTRGGEINSLWDAFLFSAAQLLTGSSVANPSTDLGKVLELVFDLWALFVVASLAGSFGAFFHARSKELNLEFERAEERLRQSLEGDAEGPLTDRPRST